MNRLAPLLLLALPSCASLVSRTPSQLELTSTPPGLAFTTDYGRSGRTPATLLPPEGARRIAVNIRSLDGTDQTFTFGQRKSWWMAGNLIIGGPIGFVIDLINPHACVWPSGGNWHINAH